TLEFAGFLEYVEDTNTVSRIMFDVRRDDLYKFQLENKNLDEFIKLILRMYTGLFTDFVNVSEEYIARKAGISEQSVYEYFKVLAKHKIISYIPKINKPIIRLLMERRRENDMYFDRKALDSRKECVVTKMEAMLRYATSDNKCRSQQLLAYFGETDVDRCGECDVCKRRNELGLSKYEFDIILEKIKRILGESPYLYNELIDKVGEDETKTVNVIKWLFDNNKVLYNEERKIIWHK
ncbi:MAG: RecQ family zinc-binding domain-containing protein, partial [Bacteroidales bacterium]|nr:RecQ family zinc-binding domain-containing protein [Bacteroidales bacterium]